MSDSSNSRRLDRRGFLGLGAGALAAAAAFEWGYKLSTRPCKSAPSNPFVAAGKPLLVAVEGEDLHAMLRAGIEALGGLDPLAKFGTEAIFRGNYVMSQPYPVTTAPEFVLAVADELKRAGVRKTSLFDSHGTRLSAGVEPEQILRRLGVLEKLTQGGVSVLARDFLDSDEFVFVRNPAWPIAKPVAVHRILHEAPIVVSLPVVKRHAYVNFTCALKMHFGSVSMADRMLVHTKDLNGRSGLMQQRLVHFADAVKPQLHIVDARAILARSGPGLGGGGAEVVPGVNKIILSGDMVAVDAYCARLMAQHDETFTPDMIARQLRHAASIGLGNADLDAVEVVEIRA